MNGLIKILFLLIVFLNLYEIGKSQSSNLFAKYNTQKGAAKITTGLEICDSLVSNPSELLRFARELLAETEQVMPGSFLHTRVLKVMADAYYYSGKNDSSGIYLHHTINTYDMSGHTDTLFIGTTYGELGYYYQTTGKRNESLLFLQKAIDLLLESPYSNPLADALSNLAFLRHWEGNFDEAIALFKQVYKIDQVSGNTTRQSNSLNSLGRMYIDWGKYETGIQYYKKSIELLDTLSDIQTLAIRYNNIGMAYQLMENHSEAIVWIEKAKKIEELSGNYNRLAIRYFNLANSHLALQNFEEAEALFMLANDIFSDSGGYGQLTKLNASLGQLYFLQNNKGKALEYYLLAQQYAELNNVLPEKSIIYKNLFQYFKETGQSEKALQYYELYISAKDSMFGIDAAKQIEELQVQHQTAQKEAEITRLETDNELKQNELVYRKRERNWALLALIVLLGFSTTIFFLFRQVKSQKSILAHQNTELDKLNKTLNRLFGIISHDLRNASAAYQSSSKIMAYHLKNGQPEKLLPLAPEIEKNATQLSSLLENLLNWSAAQIKGIEPEKKQIDVDTALEKCVYLFQERNKLKNNQFKVNGGKKQVFCDPESFQIILRNLLANAVKYTSNGTITLQCTQKGDSTEISVSDTGCGMDATTVENLNRGIFSESRRGTLGEKGTGLGFILAAEHIAKNGGAFEVKSTPNAGTTISVKFKNKQ